MPLYLSMTSPETLLRRRRLDELKVTADDDDDDDRHHRSRRPLAAAAAGRGGGATVSDGRRRPEALLLIRRRRPNLSNQALRYEDAQKNRKQMEKFKHPDIDFDKTLPVQSYRCTKASSSVDLRWNLTNESARVGAKTQLLVKSIVCKNGDTRSFPPVPRDCCMVRCGDCVESMILRQPNVSDSVDSRTKSDRQQETSAGRTCAPLVTQNDQTVTIRVCLVDATSNLAKPLCPDQAK